MWNQSGQSPFRRFAAAQVEGGSGTGVVDEPTTLADAPADAGIVLVVDDEPAIVESLVKIFKREGMTVLHASDGNTGLDLLRKHRVGVLLTDLMMPQTSGMDLLRAAKTIAPETEVVLMTAYGTVETAVDAMKEGAYDFVTKPLKRAHVVRIIRNALEKQSLLVENRSLKAQLAEKRRRQIIGTSLAWRRTMDIVMQAAPSEATVLLLGESGTGKELLARAVHDNSPRAKGPFVAVNCAAIPESILEAELFGYEKGAFTGAGSRATAASRRAHGGTLFLDEIGELRAALQVKLLRVLQEGEFERLGGSAGAQDRRPRRRRDQPRPRGRGQGRSLSRRSLLPAQRDPGARAAAARSPRRRPAARATFHARLRREKCEGHFELLAGRARAHDRICLARKCSRARECDRTRRRADARRPRRPRRRRPAARSARRGARDGQRELAGVSARHAARRDRDARDPRDAAPHARRQAPDREAARHRDAHDYRRLEGRSDDAPEADGGEPHDDAADTHEPGSKS